MQRMTTRWGAIAALAVLFSAAPTLRADDAPAKSPGQPLSLSGFKDFMARQGHANLSQEELEKLYVQFLEWNRRAKN